MRHFLVLHIFTVGETYYLLNDVEHMFRNIAQAIHLLGQTGQWELIARSYNLMAISSVNKGNVSAADGLLSDRIELLPQIWDY